jgi:hypothetical protein
MIVPRCWRAISAGTVAWLIDSGRDDLSRPDVSALGAAVALQETVGSPVASRRSNSMKVN